MTNPSPTESPPLRPYHIQAWCDRTFTSSFSVDADSPTAALAKGKEQVHDENAEECDGGYPWDTFTVEDEQGEVVASEQPPRAPSPLIDPVRELLAHLEDLASEFSICREISQSSYAKAVRAALPADAQSAKAGAA